MKKHLTDNKIDAIVEIIDGWTDRLTWELLVNKIAAKFGRYTRQALDKHARISDAFTERKKFLRSGHKRSTAHLSELAKKSVERIERLEAENRRLRAENNSLLEQFVRWQYNAAARGMTAEQINAALPAVDRERTKI